MSPAGLPSQKEGEAIVSTIEERLQQAEEIIRAQNRLVQAMLDGAVETAWPKEALVLQGIYQQRYGVDLSGQEG